MEKSKPKISLVEIVFITPLFMLNDAIGVVLLLFGLDDFFILDIIRFPLSQVYLRLKGVRGTVMLITNILETIPYIGALPNATIGWLITCWIDHHPKLFKTMVAVSAGGPIAAIGALGKKQIEQTVGVKPSFAKSYGEVKPAAQLSKLK